MASGYRTVLRRRDVLAVLGPYLLSRLPLSMNLLALLLLVRATTGSYHRAGILCATYGAAVAVAAPVLGRLVDRRGQSSVLLWTGLVHPFAVVVLAQTAVAHAFGPSLAAAAVAGASLPPLSSCMRVLWGRLLADEDERRVGYALEAVVVESAELVGPLLVSAALLLASPAAAVVAGGVLSGAGALLFRRTAASRAVTGGVGRSDWRGALGVPGVRLLLLVVLTSTATAGFVEVAVASYARGHGGVVSTGAYVALLCCGGVVAGMVAGGMRSLRGSRTPFVLAGLLVVTAGSVTLPALVSNSYAVGALLVLVGASTAPALLLQLGIMSVVAPEAVRTEAFTWGATANFIGLGLGNVAAGTIVDRWGSGAGFIAAGAPTLVAAVLVLCGSRLLRGDAAAPAGDATAPAGATAAPAVAAAATPDEPAATPSLVRSLRARIAELEGELAVAREHGRMADVEIRAQDMLARADAACAEIRERAESDAARTRQAATIAAIDIMTSAQRDASAILERARKIAARATARAADAAPTTGVRAPDAPAADGRPVLFAVPGVGLVDGSDDAAAHRRDADAPARLEEHA